MAQTGEEEERDAASAVPEQGSVSGCDLLL